MDYINERDDFTLFIDVLSDIIFEYIVQCDNTTINSEVTSESKNNDEQEVA